MEDDHIKSKILEPLNYILKNTLNTEHFGQIVILHLSNNLNFRKNDKDTKYLEALLHNLGNYNLLLDDILFQSKTLSGKTKPSANVTYGVPVTITATMYTSVEVLKEALNHADGKYFLPFLNLFQNEMESVGIELMWKNANFQNIPEEESEYFEVVQKRQRDQINFVSHVLKLELETSNVEKMIQLFHTSESMNNLNWDIENGRFNPLIYQQYCSNKNKNEFLNKIKNGEFSFSQDLKIKALNWAHKFLLELETGNK